MCDVLDKQEPIHGATRKDIEYIRDAYKNLNLEEEHPYIKEPVRKALNEIKNDELRFKIEELLATEDIELE